MDKDQLVAMEAGDWLAYLGTDARKWAQAFLTMNFAPAGIDEDLMTAWFANAIMTGHDAALGNPPLCGEHAQWLLDRAEV